MITEESLAYLSSESRRTTQWRLGEGAGRVAIKARNDYDLETDGTAVIDELLDERADLSGEQSEMNRKVQIVWAEPFSMKVFWPMLILASSMLITGCDSPTDLEKTAARLTQGMTETNVFRLFRDFKNYDQGKIDHGIAMDRWVIFQTNVQRGTIVDFVDPDGHWPQPWQFCTIFFDTNSVIVGFCYARDDGRPIGTIPRKE